MSPVDELPAAFDALHDDGLAVFADLKLLDIPTTVQRGARAVGRHGDRDHLGREGPWQAAADQQAGRGVRGQ